MRSWFAVLLVGCASESAPSIDAEVPRQLDLDIVVMPTWIEIYGNGTDFTCACDDSSLYFLASDTCADYTDGVDCSSCYPPPSCLRARLVGTSTLIEGTTYSPIFLEPPMPYPPDLVLELSGCGHAAFDIPIPVYAPPTPSITVDVSGPMITVSWQTSEPAASAFVGYTVGSFAHECHTTATAYSFTVGDTTIPSWLKVWVRAFFPVEPIESPLGSIRLWRGDVRGVQVTP